MGKLFWIRGRDVYKRQQILNLAEEFLFRDIVRQDDEFIAADAVAGIRSETGPQVIGTGPQRFIAAVMTKLIIDFF